MRAPAPSVWLLVAATAIAGAFGPGCVAHFDAMDPRPDYVARARSARTFELEDGRSPDATVETCAGAICVRGVRAQVEHGLRDVLQQFALPARAGASADYVAHLESLSIGGSSASYGRYGGGNAAEMTLSWHFTIDESATGRPVLDASNTETISVASGDFAHRFWLLEHAMVTHIAELLARSPLASHS